MRIRPPRAGRQQLNHPTGQSGPALKSRSVAGRLVQEQRFHPEEAAAVVGQVARILAGGHAVGQVHGDIRPAIIALPDGAAEDGRAALIAGPAPRPGESLPYLAPEQIDHQRTSPASDVYALGAVFFEMLVGRPPYAGAEPERVGSLVTVPGQIDGIVTAMLAEDPAARPRADEVANVLESGLTAPPKKIVRPDARKARRARLAAPVLGVLMVLLLPGLVFGGWRALSAAETRSSVGDAEPLADILPTSFALAFDLSIERDVLRSSGRVPEEFLRVTDQSIEAWSAEVDGIDAGGDPGLRRRTERTAAALERLSEFRSVVRSGDRAEMSADAAVYTSAVNGLFDLAAELPAFDDARLARQATNLESIGPVSEVLGFERTIMAEALRKRRISDRAIADLRSAQSSWTTHSASIYEDAEPGTKQALDSISGGSFAYGSFGVSSQRAVIRVLNARDIGDVAKQLEDRADGAPVDQLWLADAAVFVQDLRNVIVDAARKLADDIRREHQDAQGQTIAWGMFTGVMLVLFVGAGIALLRSRAESVDA
ncbi:nitrate- and nitrite sensing domain-containing protein [Nocardioides sp. CCNWLW239]|uniref:nitrate- and nitrite sensing domain-containing protein n=1 Tax=Nocardioides sp. CCNWLW239 TaxID=3128902 RepID=UPI00301B2110